jgi:hypothetical protein
MACPTCDHTMSRLGCQFSECHGSWACPRCGTLKIGHDDGRFDVIVPALVERCRRLAESPLIDVKKHADAMAAAMNRQLNDAWSSSGIAESINLPGGRS